MTRPAPVDIPPWGDDAALNRLPLAASLGTDVCIVGAGIAGLTTAYLLLREGRAVVVLDDGPIGGGETGRTSAHLSSAIDDRYVTLEHRHGQTGARLAAESHQEAIDLIEQIVQRESIDCDFRRLNGILAASQGEGTGLLEREFEAAERAGISDLFWVDPLFPAHDSPRALSFPRQATFHPLRYLEGLARTVERMGGRIFCHTHVESIEGGSPARVRAERGRAVGAQAIVIATNSPINNRFAVHTKQAAYRSYVIAMDIPKGALLDVLYWDTEEPYHYLRLAPGDDDTDLVIIGGEDHRTGQADDGSERYARLEAWARSRIPLIGSVRHRWSGQIMETVDGLGFIGRNPGDDENVYIASGDSGMGLTHGTIAGILLTDQIVGRPNAWGTLYSPARRSLRAIKEYLAENLNTAAQYTHWLRTGDVSSVEEITPGTGAVLRQGMHHLAVYRDEAGVLHPRSAVCPHLGGIVEWNSTEKSWDCPCHGSRFDCLGRVIDGPANHDLKVAAVPEERVAVPVATHA